ncbi:hypothetical protein VCRA2117O380_20003 [Vibrio crassostreae]|nr:hypothetical protein VCRA2117O379_20003 [Vibrio crassostreae]CAK1977201.1 hypothetical protein VCRA2117O380_20003 [Vibrio crassostreae]CAK2012765.1 hypothetical protein VCRA2119O381_350037 [Vibrio crassostreae]CAK2028383.1 hypothetical protein VCRA2119O382_20491 [Vibrio crassostreae]CAK2472911.1 hypothetical protein VCRA2113O350_20003 [Vibrio crassostreae]
MFLTLVCFGFPEVTTIKENSETLNVGIQNPQLLARCHIIIYAMCCNITLL